MSLPESTVNILNNRYYACLCSTQTLNIPYKNIKSPNIESIACKTSAFFPLVPSHCRGNPMSGQIQCKFNHTRTRFLQESSSIYFCKL